MTNQKLVISLEFIWINISIYPNYDGIIFKKEKNDHYHYVEVKQLNNTTKEKERNIRYFLGSQLMEKR